MRNITCCDNFVVPSIFICWSFAIVQNHVSWLDTGHGDALGKSLLLQYLPFLGLYLRSPHIYSRVALCFKVRKLIKNGILLFRTQKNHRTKTNVKINNTILLSTKGLSAFFEFLIFENVCVVLQTSCFNKRKHISLDVHFLKTFSTTLFNLMIIL